MTAQMILVEAQPALASTGAAVDVRLAGGGAVKPYYYGGNHYQAGITGLPTIIQSLEFDGGELGTGSVPSATELRWSPAKLSQLAAVSAYYWNDAPITVRIGPEGAYPGITLSGKVLEANAEDGSLRIALADPAADLKKPFPITRYLGTGGLEGPAEWEGTVKRRLFGRVWNVRGEPLDKANNIYGFADPTKQLQLIDAVRDKGAPAASLTTVAWAGTAAATLAALQAAVAPQGGGVICPSIACVKWWTQPAGDLTADLKGEIGTGYVETTAEIAQRLVTAAGGPAFAAGTVATAAAARTAAVGWVIRDENTATSAMLDELLGNSSLLWVLSGAGEIIIREWAWGASAANAKSHEVSRKSTFKPLATRKIGYRRNELQMARGDLAGIVLATDVGGLDISARYPDAPPLNPLEGTLYIDSTGRQYRFEGTALLFDGDPILFNGDPITVSGWIDVQDQAIPAAQAAAAAAQTTATTAVGAAATAQSAADAANAKIADIASDSILSPGEKPSIKLEYDTLIAEQTALDAQATSFGITTEKTAYDNAITALTAYLATLTTPVAWNNYSGNTAIVAATFQTKFQDVYTTKTALLVKIDAVTLSQPILSRLSSATGNALGSFISSNGLNFAQIGAVGEARDGDVVTFSLPSVPKIVFLPGGNAATAGQNIAIQDIGTTTTGFTMKAKSQGVTVGSVITDTGATAGTGSEPQQVINRTNSGTPYDGRFTYSVSVTVGNIAPGEPGNIEVGLFAKFSGTWIQIGTIYRNSTGTSTWSGTPGTIDFGAGNEFGVSVLSAEGSGTNLSSFNSVKYTLGSTSETSLTPAGASPITWLAILQ